MRRVILLLTAMAVALVATIGTALAVTKTCPSGTTSTNPCLGTAKTSTATGDDLLVGTFARDYIKALSGNDILAGGNDNDTTNGGSGNDTYSYSSPVAFLDNDSSNGLAGDRVVDASGFDTLNFSRTDGSSVTIILVKEFSPYPAIPPNTVEVTNSTGGSSWVVLGAYTVERAIGTPSTDEIRGGKEDNTLQPGPGGNDQLIDMGGCTPEADTSAECPTALAASNDTYKGFRRGSVLVKDYGGTADSVDLRPLSSEDVTFEQDEGDFYIHTGPNESVRLYRAAETGFDAVRFRIEKIVFSDITLTGVEHVLPATEASTGDGGR
jgi:Ca2+-binding RTX toxin-like protein